MKKRLFFSLTIPQHFKQELTTTLSRLDILNTLSSASPRIIKPENLHITMLFLASVDEKLIPGLIKLGKQICLDIKVFSLKLKDISLAPPGQKPRMIWAVFAENQSFTDCIALLNKTVKKYLPKDQYKPYGKSAKKPIPHITLARFKKTTKYMELPKISIKNNVLSFTSLVLMESKLAKTGAQYQILAVMPFAN